jgi:competence protein ComEA
VSQERSGPPHPSEPADPLHALRGHEPVRPLDRVWLRLQRIPPDARPWAAALALLGATTVVLLALWLARSPGTPGADGPDPLAALPYAGTSGAPGGFAGPGDTAVEHVVVHAAGAVHQPGLYRLPPGARVGELLDAAGGPTADADRDRVNLASPLADGIRVYVPRVGETELPVPETDAPGSWTSSSGDPGTIDLNRATAEQLEALPGVGPSIAGAIVDHRERNGPFRTVDDLLEVRGIGAARLEQVRALVRV